jgi:hypothetical protein
LGDSIDEYGKVENFGYCRISSGLSEVSEMPRRSRQAVQLQLFEQHGQIQALFDLQQSIKRIP